LTVSTQPSFYHTAQSSQKMIHHCELNLINFSRINALVV